MNRTPLQTDVDALLDLVEKTGKLIKDQHITANVFAIIEADPIIKKEYDRLSAIYSAAWKINNTIGKRVLFNYKMESGQSRSTKGKTTLAKSYRLLS